MWRSASPSPQEVRGTADLSNFYGVQRTSPIVLSAARPEQHPTTHKATMRIVPDQQIESLLAKLDAEGIKRYQRILSSALEKYNKDPTIIPERVVVNRPELDCVHLFMPTFADKVGVKTLGGSKEGFKGGVMLMDKDNGEVQGLLNARALTAFRTALASTIPLMKYFDTQKKEQCMTVYGCGLQAYWHAKLTLALFPESFTTVQFVVRAITDKAEDTINAIAHEFGDIADREMLWELVAADDDELDIAKSDVIYGCIPSTSPSIHLSDLSKDHQTYISLIGSYKPYMFEVDDAIVQEAMKNGKIIVDSFEHTLAEAGELIQNKVKPEDCVELGQLDSLTTKEINGNSNLVLVKIVGLALMDIAVGEEILKECTAKKIGSVVEF